MILTVGEIKDAYRSGPVVLACGCFDILTVGHVRHLQAAKKFGNLLCVLVTADRYVNKPGRPIFTEGFRMEVMDALHCVDYTVLNQWPTAAEVIRFLRPTVYVKGGEYKDSPSIQLWEERAAIESVGGRLEFTDGMELHTTEALRRLGL